MKIFNNRAYQKLVVLSLVFIFFISCSPENNSHTFRFGLDVLEKNDFQILTGKRVGVITNQTGVNTDGKHIADLLHQAQGVELVALYGPEHGIRGNIEGGFTVSTDVDEKTGVSIYSLYGKTKKPTPEMIKNIDILIFDIQDVGTRFYTYISTMALAMEAAAENNISFMVLDRPNPITGTIVEGPVLEAGFESFVGIHPIALRHGLTIGELAQLFDGEEYLNKSLDDNLHIIKMENWNRDSWYDEYPLKWIKPSPNMPDATTAILYPGIGLLEATNVSEGRGTTIPFKIIGAPWLDNSKLVEQLMEIGFDGIKIDTASFVPVDMPGAAMNPKYEDRKCNALSLTVTNPHTFKSVEFGIHLISLISKNHPDEFDWRSERSIDIMSGTDAFRIALDSGKSAEEIIDMFPIEEFLTIRQKYLLYE